MDYNRIWETISEKLDKVIEEDKRNPLLLIGGYRHGEVMPLDNSALFDEFLDGDPEWDAMEVDPKAEYGKQFEQFTEALRKGYRFGDYQEFAPLQSRLLTLKDKAERLAEQDKRPTELLEAVQSVARVRCNGYADSVSLRGWNDNYCELEEYLEQLSNL